MCHFLLMAFDSQWLKPRRRASNPQVAKSTFIRCPRPSQKKSSLRCTLRRNPTIPSWSHPVSPSTTRSFLASARDLAAGLHSLRCVPPPPRCIHSKYAHRPTNLIFKTFWDATGRLWATGALQGKFVGMFVSTNGLGGGQEGTFFSSLTTFVHHGMIFVPLGYKNAVAQLSNIEQVHGGESETILIYHRRIQVLTDFFPNQAHLSVLERLLGLTVRVNRVLLSSRSPRFRVGRSMRLSIGHTAPPNWHEALICSAASSHLAVSACKSIVNIINNTYFHSEHSAKLEHRFKLVTRGQGLGRGRLGGRTGCRHRCDPVTQCDNRSR